MSSALTKVVDIEGESYLSRVLEAEDYWLALCLDSWLSSRSLSSLIWWLYQTQCFVDYRLLHTETLSESSELVQGGSDHLLGAWHSADGVKNVEEDRMH